MAFQKALIERALGALGYPPCAKYPEDGSFRIDHPARP